MLKLCYRFAFIVMSISVCYWLQLWIFAKVFVIVSWCRQSSNFFHCTPAIVLNDIHTSFCMTYIYNICVSTTILLPSLLVDRAYGLAVFIGVKLSLRCSTCRQAPRLSGRRTHSLLGLFYNFLYNIVHNICTPFSDQSPAAILKKKWKWTPN